MNKKKIENARAQQLSDELFSLILTVRPKRHFETKRKLLFDIFVHYESFEKNLLQCVRIRKINQLTSITLK